MIKWCSYCQKLIGEVEPFEVLEMSHGICSTCLKSERYGAASQKSVQVLARFFGKVQELGETGDLSRASEVMQKGLDLGLRPLDILMGIIQPSLYRVGAAWEAGEITVAEEHRFTSFASRVVELCYQRFQKYFDEPKEKTQNHVDFLLVNAPGNFHSLGLKMIELWLVVHEFSVFTVIPGIPEGEILALVKERQPKYVGLSIALCEQQSFVSRFNDMLKKLALSSDVPFERPTLIVGGPALRRSDWKNEALENVVYCREISEFQQFLLPRLC